MLNKHKWLNDVHVLIEQHLLLWCPYCLSNIERLYYLVAIHCSGFVPSTVLAELFVWLLNKTPSLIVNASYVTLLLLFSRLVHSGKVFLHCYINGDILDSSSTKSTFQTATIWNIPNWHSHSPIVNMNSWFPHYIVPLRRGTSTAHVVTLCRCLTSPSRACSPLTSLILLEWQCSTFITSQSLLLQTRLKTSYEQPISWTSKKLWHLLQSKIWKQNCAPPSHVNLVNYNTKCKFS